VGWKGGCARPRSLAGGAPIKYEVIIYWSEEDQAFIAEVPELAGCMADGPTSAEALRNVTQVAEEWIETATSLGRPIPSRAGG
jgi:predicted RNase H-like HicB family nuclease